jgi:D-alanyl-D-alanine carboxypeptidase
MELPPLPADYEKRMPRFDEEVSLRVVGMDAFGREARLSAYAAEAWASMRRESEEVGVRLLLLSGFRSIDRQAEIVRRKLSAGFSLDDILRVSAFPGFSEHHTGRAIDIGSPDCEHLSEAFDATCEFRWLCHHASRFGFSLSYPRGNPYGIAYEPWHWCMSKKEKPNHEKIELDKDAC